LSPEEGNLLPDFQESITMTTPQAPILNLASDNVSGMSQPVLAALIAANSGPEPAYGSDQWTARAEALLSEVFEHEVSVFLVATGTGANALALAAMSPPWGAIFCHSEAHVLDDECGAPEMFTDGAKLVGVPGVGGKLTVEALAPVVSHFAPGVIKSVQPAALSISQVTEAGTIYTIDEIKALGQFAKQRKLMFHLDGARFCNAMVTLGCTPAEMTWKSGVDIVTFGATKNGCMACEAIIFFNKTDAESMPFRRKRGGHTVSKGRLLGAQMVGYLENDHWIDNARHTNAMATALRQGLETIPGVKLPWPTQANEVFVVVPQSAAERLTRNKIRAATWDSVSLPAGFSIGKDEQFLRFVTSFTTTKTDIATVLQTITG
jgi:threonine aldolase